MSVSFAAGIAFHYALVHFSPRTPAIQTVRAKGGGVSVMAEMTSPPIHYPTEAFCEIGLEADRILADVTGSDHALGRYIYILPVFYGYEIVIHEKPDKPYLTDKERDEFRDRIQTRMFELARKYAPPHTAKTSTEPFVE